MTVVNVLILGGSGFIGSHVVRHLLARGHQVAVFHRGQTAAELGSEVIHLFGERQRLTEFIPRFESFAPEVVLDMLAYTEHDAHSLVETFRGLVKRLVCVSSMDVYRAYGLFRRLEVGSSDSEPFDEHAALRSTLYPYRVLARGPDDFLYDYEKILVEKIVREKADAPATILRLPQVFGPNDKQHRLAEYLGAMDRGENIVLDAEKARWRWTRGYVEDVALAIALVVADPRAAGRTYNVGEEQAQTEMDWIQAIGSAAGWSGQIKMATRTVRRTHPAKSYDWRHHLAADTNRIRRELGYQDILSQQEALRRTITWERANPAGLEPS